MLTSTRLNFTRHGAVMAFTLRYTARILVLLLLLVLPAPHSHARAACCYVCPQSAAAAAPQAQGESDSPLADEVREAEKTDNALAGDEKGVPQDAAPPSPSDSQSGDDEDEDDSANGSDESVDRPDDSADESADKALAPDETEPPQASVAPRSDAPPTPAKPAASTGAVEATADRADVATTADQNAVSIDFLFDGKSPSSVDQLRAMETHFAELADQVAPATVNIQIGMAQGSGVVVSRDGYILTAAHVIGRPAATATVTFPDGKQVKAKTLGLARRLDYGMLKIMEEEGDRFPYLDMGYSAELKQGQWVMAVGHPGGIDEKRGLVFRAGRIIANSMDKLQTDCTLVGGDSGGPLVDMNGEVIGIHSRIGSKLWDNLHAPVDVYSENWDRMDKGLVIDGTPHLGFNVKPNTIRVTSVETDGPAKSAGMKVQDRIVEVNGRSIDDYDDLKIAIAKLLPYQKVGFKVKRRSKVIELEIDVREKR